MGRKTRGSLRENSRANWNLTLEKSLVALLHEHNVAGFRDDNKWSSEAWNKIVKEFHERNRYMSFSKAQIQDKEGQMKRDYKMLKEVRRQRGWTWNEDRCMIEAGPALWDNLITKFPKAKKFRNNRSSFPLFDELRELYDGHLTEGICNFTSNESPQDPPLRQVENTDEIQDLEEDMAYDVEGEDTQVQRIEDEDEDEDEDDYASSERNEQILERRAATESRNKKEKEAKRPKKSGNVEGSMERHLEMNTKQVGDKAAQFAKIKEAAQGTDFSIKRSVSVLNSMEVTTEEKAKAYAIFKNQDNREIFLSACSEDPESAMIWLRNEMA